MTPPNQDLTALQARFVEEYLVDLNAAAAARRAGYAESCANQQGHKNLQKPHIQGAIAQAMEARSRRTEIEADAVLEELAAVGFARGEELDEFKASASDKVRALVKLGEHLGLWRDDRDFRVSVFHWFAGLPPERLSEIEEASDEELREMFESKTPAFFSGWAQKGGRWQ